MAAFRFFYSVVAGVVLAMICFFAVELVSAVLHPFPEGFQYTQEEIVEHVKRYPAMVLAVCFLLWLALAFVSTWVAARLGGLWPGVVVGVLLLAMFGCNALTLPYPVWFPVGTLLGFPAMSGAALWTIVRPITGPQP